MLGDPINLIDPTGNFASFILGFITDAGIEILIQVIIDGKSFGCIDYGAVAINAAMGSASGGLSALNKLKRLRKAGGCSFTPDTLVPTKEGDKAIGDIEIGDLVLSKADDDETAETSWRAVTNTFKDWHKETLTFTVEDETGISESITTTAEHPFYVVDSGWVAAGEIPAGAVISGSDPDSYIKITNIIVNHQAQWAYNLTVDTDHTYFVGETNMWVHNVCEVSFGLATPSGIKLSGHAFESLKRHGFKNLNQVEGILKNATQKITQKDGATVFIQKIGKGGKARYNLIVQGEAGIVTGMRNFTKKELTNMGRNQGWESSIF
ncbi:polymorphic toxin-type HINT domain-containing protein [Pseudoalteromonas denitrificans]|uniref:Intein C-terminal splicing region/intein N-terminal splicing region n=1 Tax=Pseudoalteromonas denitrificans DSM 6059 TaxID=1123010 RepID=A0A1I1T9E2_9GAMM|nr:polymorphic toxin-type HINT domain-containing protein [Pseudoalteromonas denitrificans]SFD53728.1 intein C-terminal splicing region/intein N-terminal splicing region [Pseudoalteromonas denitrificans DSM 6059]